MQVVRKLGEGGMGAVWLVRSGGVERALKRLSIEADPESLERFRREGEALARVANHPGVVQIHATHHTPFAALELEFIDGPDLESRLGSGPLELEESVEIATAVAEALAHLHSHGVVHRDLKPSNILLAPRGPVLTDFGVSRIESLETLTRTGAIVGTPSIMSPEQIEGRAVDARSDVWAFGVLLYRLLTGRLPFPSDSPVGVMRSVLMVDPEAPARTRPEIPRWLDDLVLDCLEKDPDKRPSGGRDLVQRLATRPTSRSESSRRSFALQLLGGLALVVALGLTGAFGFQTWQAGEQRRALRDRLIASIRTHLRELDGKAGLLARAVLVEPLRAPGRRLQAGPRATDRELAECQQTFDELVDAVSRLEPLIESNREARESLDRLIKRRSASLAILIVADPAEGFRGEWSLPRPLELLRKPLALYVYRDSDGFARTQDPDAEVILRPLLEFRSVWHGARSEASLEDIARRNAVAVKRELLSLALCRSLFLELLKDPESRDARALIGDFADSGRPRSHTVEWHAVLLKESTPEMSPVVWLRAVTKARELAGEPAHLVTDFPLLLRRRPELQPLMIGVVEELCRSKPVVELAPFERLDVMTKVALSLADGGVTVWALREMNPDVLGGMLKHSTGEEGEGRESLVRHLRLLFRFAQLDRFPRIDGDLFRRVVRAWMAVADSRTLVELPRGAGLEDASVASRLLLYEGSTCKGSAIDFAEARARLGEAIQRDPGPPAILSHAARRFIEGTREREKERLVRVEGEPESWLPVARLVAQSSDPSRDATLSTIAYREQALNAPAEQRLAIAELLATEAENHAGRGLDVYKDVIRKRRWTAIAIRAQALVDLGRHEPAIQLLEAVKPAALRPRDTRVLADWLDRLGRRERAEAILRRQLEATLDTGELAKLVQKLFEIGCAEDARRGLAQLSKRKTESPEAVLRLVDLQILAGDAAAARDKLEVLAGMKLTGLHRIEAAQRCLRIDDAAAALRWLKPEVTETGPAGQALRKRHAELLKTIQERRGSVEPGGRDGGS